MTNQRQWRDFITALQESVSDQYSAAYPKIVDVLRASRNRLTELVNPRWLSESAVADTNTHCIESRAETPPALAPTLPQD